MTTAQDTVGKRLRNAVRTPATWHYLSLGVGLVVILVLQESQWFFFDEWAFLKLNGPGLLTPHVGHWSTSPMLVYEALRALFGLHSYMPYATLVTLIHLCVAHLIWRITLRSGANPWIATACTVVFIFFGTGNENILWAFQIGFVGAIALGLLAFYLASGPELSRSRFIAIVALSVFSLTWSGTALPVLAATALVLWLRHGWRKAAICLGIALAVYLSWYVLFALHSPGNPDTGGFGLHKTFVSMPEFLGVMLILGFGNVFPLFELGALILVVFAVWLVRSLIKRVALPEMLPGLALGLAAVIFAVLTAYSRAALSIGAGQSSRYIYTIFAFLLPLFAVALSRLARNRRRFLIPISALVLVLACYQAVVLVDAANSQAKTEQGSQRLLSASLHLYVVHAKGLELLADPDPKNAPDIDLEDLIRLYKAGFISVGPYTSADLAHADANVDPRG